MRSILFIRGHSSVDRFADAFVNAHKVEYASSVGAVLRNATRNIWRKREQDGWQRASGFKVRERAAGSER